MRPCPNCGRPIEDGRTLCPHCGAAVPETGAVWPPQVAGSGPPLPPPYPERLLTGNPRRDFGIGCGSILAPLVLTLLVSLVNMRAWIVCLGVFFLLGLIGLIVYFPLRARYPVVGRGLGWGTLTVPLFYLGAFVTCFAAAARS